MKIPYFCERCRQQYKSSIGFKNHTARNVNHKPSKPSTDNALLEAHKKLRDL